ncbi:hypothetical protein ACP275_13G143600 [Erythranthe tilingii]
MTDVSISLPAKRKRGRPRKDNHLYREGGTTSTNSPKHPTQEFDKNSQNAPVVDDTLVGSTVHGVIDGSFDAGYLISVRIGNSETAFRGVVFQPRKFVPITSANDVAPQAKMYQRREINNDIVPSQNITGAFSPQPENPVFRPVLPPLSATTATTPSYPTSNNNNTHSNFLHNNKQQQPPFLHSTGNLRMVEEDEVMQAFEVSTSSKAMSKNIPESLFKGGNEMIDKGGPNLEQLHHNFMEDMPRCAFEIQRDEMICPDNYHQNLLTNHHHHQNPDKLFLTSDHLKLDLSNSSPHEKKPEQLQLVETNYLGLNGLKSPSLGYQQALVAGNPLLLPPAFIGEPALDFMLGKTAHKSPTNSRTNLEVESSGGAGAGAGAPYDLELATPQSNVNARTVNANQTNSSAACINDMDFDLSDVVQPTESHGRQSYLSETEHR